ncbi:MAG: Trm112 family protein [Candidatus Aenigmarchaeota archaeon]|nr:Trm112 family protein [Candidatus Aenigmarchaeota archaeon]
MLPEELLEIMACPKCKSDLEYDNAANKLTCNACRLRYAVLDGDIPNMIIDEAEKF